MTLPSGSGMGSTVAVGGFEITSNEDTASMVAALTPAEPKSSQPRVLVDKGQPVGEEDAEKRKVSEAASELGKKGGEAAAKARKAEAKKGATVGGGGEGDKVEAAKSGGGKDGAKAEPDEDDDQETDPAASEKLGKPRHDPKARIAQLAREKKEAEERAARAERALAERTTQPPAAEKKADAPPAETKRQKPLLKDFLPNYETYEEAQEAWADARDKFNREEWEADHAKRETQRAALSAHERRYRDRDATFTGHVEAAVTADPQFFDKLSEDIANMVPTVSFDPQSGEVVIVEKPTAENVIADEIAASDQAPALMLYLSEHPDEFQRLRALRTSEDVKVEVRLIARGLQRPNAATSGTSFRREPSKASPPPEPVKGSPHTAQPDLHGNIDLDTYVSRLPADRRPRLQR